MFRPSRWPAVSNHTNRFIAVGSKLGGSRGMWLGMGMPGCSSPAKKNTSTAFQQFPQSSTGMEFDSLAFSASRLAPKKDDRVYCPACQEECEPEPSSSGVASDPPTCPVCEAMCIEPPVEPQVSKLLAVHVCSLVLWVPLPYWPSAAAWCSDKHRLFPWALLLSSHLKKKKMEI